MNAELEASENNNLGALVNELKNIQGLTGKNVSEALKELQKNPNSALSKILGSGSGDDNSDLESFESGFEKDTL